MAERGLHITGVDSSPTLISLCRQRLPDQERLVDDMRSLRLPRRFDGVLAWDSFFHLTPSDQRRMFNVFARHAALSAVLMFNSGPDYGEGVGEYRGDPLYHASFSPDEYTALLSDISFEVIAHAVEDWKTGGGRAVSLSRGREDQNAVQQFQRFSVGNPVPMSPPGTKTTWRDVRYPVAISG
jgi:hypothetical protein